MSVFLQPIYTQTVGSGGSTGAITFNNIPQTFTDICVFVSTRSVRSGNPTDDIYCNFNNVNSSNTQHSVSTLWGNGSLTGSSRGASSWIIGFGVQPAATGTANTFSSGLLYIPNYTSSNYKSFTIDFVNENNTTTLGTGAGLNMEAGLFSSTSAITAISFLGGYSNFAQYSTFSLYGVLRQGI